MKRFIHIVLAVVLALFVCAVFLVAADWMIRLTSPMFFSNTVSQFKYDEELGSIAKPNLNLHLLTDHLIEVTTNDVGSRNFASSSTLGSYQKMIFAVGDSFTEGVGNLNDESYPFYLDLLLNQVDDEYRRNYAVVNLGLGAYGSIQSAKIVDRFAKILNRPPDIIIYLICDNDPSDDAGFLNGLKHDNVVDGSPRFPGWYIRLNQTLEQSQIYLRAKMAGRAIRNRMLTPASAVPVPEGAPATDDPESVLPGLRELRKTADRYHSRVILSYTEIDQPMYDVVQAYAARNGWGFIDYRPAVTRTLGAMPSLPTHHTHSGGHFRSWVNLTIARRAAVADSFAVEAPRYDRLMDTPTAAGAAPQLLERDAIPARFKWNLTHIFSDWNAWQAAYDELEVKIAAFAALQGTLARGRRSAARGVQAPDEIGQLEYKVWYFASLWYDQDQRDNEINARRQQVQILFAKAAQASAWFNPELLGIPLPTVQEWMARNPGAGGLPLRHRGPLPAAGARARRQGRAPAVAVEPFFVDAVRRVCGAVDRRRQAPDAAAVERHGGHADLRAVPRDSGDEPQPGRSRRGVRRVSQAVRGERQHVRVALQRRPAARLVPRAVARLPLDARRGAPRQQHSDGGRREPDRDDEGRAPSRSGGITGCASACSASTRITRTTRRFRWSTSTGSIRTTMCSSGCRRRWRRSAPTTSGSCARCWTASGSTSTRTPASAAARIRRPCTASIRTCC